jgi:hypothetical protein
VQADVSHGTSKRMPVNSHNTVLETYFHCQGDIRLNRAIGKQSAPDLHRGTSHQRSGVLEGNIIKRLSCHRRGRR